MTISATSNKSNQISADVRQKVFQAIDAIQYGSVEIIIHDGRIMQIECREKIRIDRLGSACKGK
jgi:hypothetical protein